MLDLDGLAHLTAFDVQVVKGWCFQQACPVIGVTSPDSVSALDVRQCVDLVLEKTSSEPLPRELNRLLRNIKRFPQASMVLVQVLRAIEQVPAEQALVIESLAYATLQAGQEFAKWLSEYRQRPQPSLPCSEEPAVLMEREGDALALVLNRPQLSNSYSVEMREALHEAFVLANSDDSIQSISVSARGRCFSTGGELSEFGTVSDAATAHLIRSLNLPARQLLKCAPKTHVHVHKACIGSGIELAAFAGHLSAEPDTFFWLPELTMGLIPGAGGCVSISRRIGRQNAAYMVLLNKKINAATALQWGLIDEIRAG